MPTNNEKLLFYIPFSEAELVELINIMPYGLARIVLAIYYYRKNTVNRIIDMYNEWQTFFEESNHSVDTFILYAEVMNHVCDYYKQIVKYEFNPMRYAKCKAIEFVIGLDSSETFDFRMQEVFNAYSNNHQLTKTV